MSVFSIFSNLSEESIVTICCAAAPVVLTGLGVGIKYSAKYIRGKVTANKEAKNKLASRIAELIDKVDAVDEDLYSVEKDLYLSGEESALIDVACSSCGKTAKISKEKYASGKAFCRCCGNEMRFETETIAANGNECVKELDLTDRKATSKDKVFDKFKESKHPTLRQMRSVLERVKKQTDAVDYGLGEVEKDLYLSEDAMDQRYQITCPVCKSTTSFGADIDIAGLVFCENCGKQMKTSDKDKSKESEKERGKKNRTHLKARIKELEAAADELQEQLNVIDEDLGDVEKDLYEDNENDSTNDNDENYDVVQYEVTCPICGHSTPLDVELALKRELDCPNCGEKLEFAGDQEKLGFTFDQEIAAQDDFLPTIPLFEEQDYS